MVRSATALLAVLILSGFAWYQQVATHTVVDGDTLWDLAEHYYDSPWEWRRIWEANRDSVPNPNLIYPDQVLTIPDRQATVTEVAVQPPGRVPAPPPVASSVGDRTVFYQATSVMAAGVTRMGELEYLAVPRDAVYSAPWMVGLEEEPESFGQIEGFAGGITSSETPRGYNRLRISFTNGAPRVGDRVQTFRVFRVIEDVGRVVRPTGVVTVSDVDEEGAVGIVTNEFHRMQLGDLVGPLPEYGLSIGQYAGPTEDDSHAMIMGFADLHVLQNVQSIAFLDVGADDGITIGDEFDYVNPEAGSDAVEGRLQVVGVKPNMASARIVEMDDVVFRQGLVVQLVRKMR
jgi:LysM repeat protein